MFENFQMSILHYYHLHWQVKGGTMLSKSIYVTITKVLRNESAKPKSP